MNKNQNVILGFVLGVAAGAVAGMLLAPDSGEQTRRKISGKAKGVSDDLGAQLNSTINKLSAYVEKVQSQAKGLVGDAKAKAENLN